MLEATPVPTLDGAGITHTSSNIGWQWGALLGPAMDGTGGTILVQFQLWMVQVKNSQLQHGMAMGSTPSSSIGWHWESIRNSSIGGCWTNTGFQHWRALGRTALVPALDGIGQQS